MKLDIPVGDFAGYIFDLDGTLVDTMPLHYRAWDLAMRKAGLTAPLQADAATVGLRQQQVGETVAVEVAHPALRVDQLFVVTWLKEQLASAERACK